MEGQSNGGQSQYLYQNWSPLVRRNTYTASTPLSPQSIPQQHFASPLDILPNLLPQQSAAYQAQLANYNKLLASGGRSTRVQSSPLPPHFSSGFQAPRKSSHSHESSSTSRNSARGHGNKKSPNPAKGEHSLIMTEEPTAATSTTPKMSDKKLDYSKQLPSRPLAQHHNTSLSHQSSSVPSTPHQHARKFSSGSREPSPNALPNHSPRSAYSETAALPSYRPFVPRMTQCKYETAMQFSRRRMAYSIGSDKLERVKMDKIKPKMTEEDERILSTDMRELYDRLLPTQDGEARRTEFVEKLERMLNKEWPGHDIEVHMFGSSGNMLCTDDSDVDICITTEWKELENVCKLAELLARNGMEKVVCVSTAKVPIVKVWDPELNLAVDMNVNNPLALENTRMIKTYVEIDERVRPLAMVIKHWTKRRIVNDAAFGGTLSSYTWICMIINFLQCRRPAVLPALHQRPNQKLKTKDGEQSSFADDVDALKTFGKQNKETSAQLLFQFFRFYAHDMDYDANVISVRNGKLISKTEKGWHLGNNNMLCVEEPFNTVRNLGNTADDTSFRGLHMELRRAFDLISEGKLDECCEQYVFPKEEERIWEKPVPQPRPIISRTPSQSRNNRGAFRGRGGHRNNNNNGGGRRVSTGAFENNNGQPFMQVPQQPFVSAEWLHAQSQMHADLNSQLSQLKAQENNLRTMLYQQSQQYAQMQIQSNWQIQRNGGLTPQERNRGSSFHEAPLTAPLTAPLRQDMYFYPVPQPPTGYVSNTLPSSPSLQSATPDLRRDSSRQSLAGGNGLSGGAGSTLRSHSQPASRTMQNVGTSHTPTVSGYGFNNYSPYVAQPNVQMPIFTAADDNGDDIDARRILPMSMSPPNNHAPKEYVGYYVQPTQYQARQEPMVLPSIPAFGDVNSSRTRRPSSDQFPHAIFDRVRRTSRSPSPLGHNRSYSIDTNGTLMSGQQAPALGRASEQGPAVVNGSTPGASHKALNPSLLSGSAVSEEPGLDAAMGPIGPTNEVNLADMDSRPYANGFLSQPPVPISKSRDSLQQAPAVVNGSQHISTDALPNMSGLGLGISNALSTPTQSLNLTPAEPATVQLRLSPSSRSRLQKQNGGMSPLDIGMSQQLSEQLVRDDMPHLSPVYETRSPSPTASRKLDVNTQQTKKGSIPTSSKADASAALKLALTNAQKPLSSSVLSTANSNGHTRNSKSEGGGTGSGWQKQKQKKGKAPLNEQKASQSVNQPFSEKAPVKESERKGG